MRISILGLGYVGSVAAACLARDGHQVIGVDADPVKVEHINRGASPILEPGLSELIAAGRRNGRLTATLDPDYAVRDTSLTFISVGTPSGEDGSLSLGYVSRACNQIGQALAEKPDFHVVVTRSTVLPGSVRNVVIPTLERASLKRAGIDFGVCVNPEFLREGTAISDFDNPPKTVIGATDSRSAEMLKRLYAHLNAPLLVTPLAVAEAVKYADNAWHALKIAFANEIGAICEKAGVDAQAVMDVFCHDLKLNISPAYLRPGMAFGGSCLPKDVRALNHFARGMNVETPLLGSILAANDRQIERHLSAVESPGNRRLGFLGISFKAATDDLRESPVLRMIDSLHERGYAIKIYDPWVSVASVQGANRSYIRNELPHILNMLTDDLQEFMDHAETVVIANRSPLYRGVLKKIGRNRSVVDLVNVVPQCRRCCIYPNNSSGLHNGQATAVAV
ncbi:MAG TPA: UDP-glucose/GDP-mannose dehydrogenase family protein [Bryobacteraceae bacterium]|nr:UDP-glucose/GDP-mannose dehydrogenase family protein [Bryobacteraceae bacterium]